MVNSVRLTLDDSISAFETLVADLASRRQIVVSRIDAIGTQYHAHSEIQTARYKKNVAQLDLPTRGLLWNIQEQTTPIALGEEKKEYSLHRLDQKLAEYNARIKTVQEQAVLAEQRIDYGKLSFLGVNLEGWKFWNKSTNQRNQAAIDKYNKQAQSLTAERSVFQSARDSLDTKIQKEAKQCQLDAALDIQNIKIDLQSQLDLERNMPYVDTILDALHREKAATPVGASSFDRIDDIGVAGNIQWDMHPAEMINHLQTLEDLHIYDTLRSARYRCKQEEKIEAAHRIMAQSLNRQSIDDLSQHLIRDMPFECNLSSPYLGHFSDRRTVPQQIDITYDLHDPAFTYATSRKNVSVFSANLFWFPETRMLGIESVRTHTDLQGSGVGRVAIRNIFDLARSLGAERIELLAGRSTGPLFWAKCGAKLQSKGVRTGGDMHGHGAEYYPGSDDIIACLRYPLEYALGKGHVDAAEHAEICALAASDAPEQAIWHIAGNSKKVPRRYGRGEITVAESLLTDENGSLQITYAAVFDLRPMGADPRQTDLMNRYLSSNLTADTTRYEAARNKIIAKEPNSYSPLKTPDRPAPDMGSTEIHAVL